MRVYTNMFKVHSVARKKEEKQRIIKTILKVLKNNSSRSQKIVIRHAEENHTFPFILWKHLND